MRKSVKYICEFGFNGKGNFDMNFKRSDGKEMHKEDLHVIVDLYNALGLLAEEYEGRRSDDFGG